MEESASAPKYPWLTIWVQPRGTIREILDYDPEYFVIPLALLSGFIQTLGRATGNSFGDQYDLIMLIPLVLIVGPIVGLISLYVGGAILTWVGGRFGGQGSSQDVRAALAWSSIPQILILILNLLLIAILGSEAFTSETPRLDRWIADGSVKGILAILILLGVGFLSIVISIWTIFISLKCLGEAHRFSAWRALFTFLLPGAVLVLIALICVIPGVLFAG